MNTTNTLTDTITPALSRDDMRAAVVRTLWGFTHLNSLLFSRDKNADEDPVPRQLAEVLDCARPVTFMDLLEATPQEHGVTWEQVKDTALACSIEALYDFAYLGTFDPAAYPTELGDETQARWISCALRDFAGSKHLTELHGYTGRDEVVAAQQLLRICETANARHILEGASETFMCDDEVDVDRLTIKQIALVSGIKEDSLRVLANPKRANPLPTKNEKGKTYVKPSDARDWLKARGRYVPIRPRESKSLLLDLKIRAFRSRSDVCDAIADHLQALASSRGQFDPVRKRLIEIAPELYYEHQHGEHMLVPGLELEEARLDDLNLVRRIGEAVGLDADLLVLKVEEVLARERWARLDAELRARTGKRPKGAAAQSPKEGAW